MRTAQVVILVLLSFILVVLWRQYMAVVTYQRGFDDLNCDILQLCSHNVQCKSGDFPFRYGRTDFHIEEADFRETRMSADEVVAILGQLNTRVSLVIIERDSSTDDDARSIALHRNVVRCERK